MDGPTQGAVTANGRPRTGGRGSKSAGAFRTISEVADELDVAQHVLRFWESKFPQVRPLKRGGGRRYYRPDDVDLLRRIRSLLYDEGYTIKGAQKLLKGQRRPSTGRVVDSGPGQDIKTSIKDDADLSPQASLDAEDAQQPPALDPDVRHSLDSLRNDLVELRDILRKRKR
ncbi:MAG: MerR family transcriptional regulator [Geminicoccaceae bacterium]